MDSMNPQIILTTIICTYIIFLKKSKGASFVLKSVLVKWLAVHVPAIHLEHYASVPI